VFEYRVTKYDPAYRDASGTYTRDEWTSVTDIGRSFQGVVLTREDYQRAEDAYVTTALAFLRETAVSSLAVAGLESHSGESSLTDGALLELDQADAVIRQLLREEFWCRLEAANGFIHVGYEYYLYVGVGRACPAAQELSRTLGLFVEPFLSPYRER
jgi:hypothetical protein